MKRIEKTFSQAGMGVILTVLMLCAMTSVAEAAIGKITAYSGEVLIQSGSQKVVAVTAVGVPVNEGDFIQTKEGTAQVTLNDGSQMKVNPYTTAAIQERDEEQGVIFKTKQAVRRITVYVGKIWFKSGASDRKNYIQTPTAVCGLRGSEAEMGYDNLNSYLNVLSGQPSIIGAVVQGFFNDPGIDAATKNAVYAQLAAAFRSGSVVDALNAAKIAATERAKNPDLNVKAQAQEALRVIQQQIDAGGAPPAQTTMMTTVQAGPSTSVLTTVSTTTSTTTIRKTSPSQ